MLLALPVHLRPSCINTPCSFMGMGFEQVIFAENTHIGAHLGSDYTLYSPREHMFEQSHGAGRWTDESTSA